MTYLFDFDGTLVDSMPVYGSVMLRILKENNIKYPDDILKTITPLGLLGTADYFIKLGIKRSREEIINIMEKYMLKEYEHNIPAKKNVKETLLKLKNRGDDLNVLTASPHITLDACLKRLGLWDIFTNIWSCDDFGTTKSDPEIYKMVAEKLSMKPENVLFLDDNLNADKTAKEAGMLVCGVYDLTSEEYVDEMKSATDFYIYDMAELLEVRI